MLNLFLQVMMYCNNKSIAVGIVFTMTLISSSLNINGLGWHLSIGVIRYKILKSYKATINVKYGCV